MTVSPSKWLSNSNWRLKYHTPVAWTVNRYCTALKLSLLGMQVLIQNGELLTGGLCKKTLGASGGSLIHVIMMEHGPEAARAFLSQCQYLTNHWLLQHGMSIGIGDTVADTETMGAINDTINRVCHDDLSVQPQVFALEA